ncbi:response regulator [Aquabacterium sp.]|uniref:response regulator n=1 Tax=Aquabacterium sp. TaxID=1872578 RepID=UPI0035B38657
MSHKKDFMRSPWTVFLGLIALIVTGLAAWRWGWSGLGLTLAAWAAVGMALTARQKNIPAPDQPPSTVPADAQPSSNSPAVPPAGSDNARWLQLANDLAEAAYQAGSIEQALQRVGQALHHHLGSRSWICLRVDGWNGETALLRPWIDTGRAGDVIDVSAIAATHRDDKPLGQALRSLKHCLAQVSSAANPAATPWRASTTRQVLALPVAVEGRPLALLEFADPTFTADGLDQVLSLAALQLSFVAERDANQALMANSAEHVSRLALVASRITSGVAITDRQGTIEWVNSAFIALTGWPEDRVLGRRLTELLNQDDMASSAVQELEEHLAQGVPFRLSYEATREAGKIRTRYWSEIDALQMLDETGGRSQFVCLFNDVSRRKAQEHVREQEREFLEALLGNLPVSLFVLDPSNFHVVAINRYTELEFKLQRDLVIGKSLGQVLAPSVLDLSIPFMMQALESGQTIEHDFNWQSDDGARVVNARHFALRHSNGRPRLLLSLVRDITASRQAQADLEESERRFRELVESMDDAVYVSTAGRRRFLYLSPRTSALLGMSAADIHTQPQRVRSMIVPEDLAKFTEQELHEKAGEPTDTLLRLQIPQKGLRWFRHRTRTRQLTNGHFRIYGLITDVTDEHRQALELERARDMAEAASQAKSQFMANMSHEIRTPMNGILGMTELLLGTQLNDKQRRFAQAVYRSGESLLEIINDILDFAKIEAGRLELATCDFVLRTLVEDTLELMAPRAHEKGLELNFREQPGLPAVIHGDPLRLRQILTNLVANAIKFTEHGEIVVDIRRAVGRGVGSPTHSTAQTIDLEFMVRDTGIGIPSDVIPRLFSAFVQANVGMARRYGGTGLGLAISKQLVELMGGQIEAHSAPGVGSEFVFRIPVRIGDTQADMAMLEEPGMPSLNVLVVDDNDTNRTVIENMLTAWGMRVSQASNGREALALLTTDPDEAGTFDLALVDMQMPEMDGIALAHAVRDSGTCPDLKMILLSSVSSPDDVRKAQDAGFQRFVSKPLRKAELRQAILGVSGERTEGQSEVRRLNKSVLVVEDNPVNQEVCTQMLRRLGCEVRLASSALEGLRKLGEQTFDLVLMDIQMPGMDGIEALTWFRRGNSNRFTFVTPVDTPVIAVTANALEGDEDRFLGLGFDDYLSKPFRQSQLLKILVEHTHISQDALTAPDSAPAASAQPDNAAADTRVEPPANKPEADAWAGVLDKDALQRLRDLDPRGENRLIERVSKAFETSVGRMLPQLDEAIKIGDHAGIAHVAHTLKSSSASIGALKLSQMCAEIEAMIRRQTGEDLSQQVSAIRPEVERTVSSLRSLLEAQA